MRRIKYLWALVALVLLSLLMTPAARAAAVGRFTMVQGKVEVLHHGKVPAVAAKLNDGVEAGDVIRTKASARTQVKFVDDSTIALAPESRLAVADFSFDADTGRRRRAVLRFFKGVFHTLVSRVQPGQQPDFMMETHTAILGVRGTETYTVLLPAATGAYLVSGVLEASSNNPQIPASVLLNNMQYTMIPVGQAPRLPQKLTPALLQVLKNLMVTGLQENAYLGAGAAPGIGAGPKIPEIIGYPGAPELYRQPVIPPTLVPPAPTPQRGPSPAPGPGAPGPTGR
jgi:hypothetical protein